MFDKIFNFQCSSSHNKVSQMDRFVFLYLYLIKIRWIQAKNFFYLKPSLWELLFYPKSKVSKLLQKVPENCPQRLYLHEILHVRQFCLEHLINGWADVIRPLAFEATPILKNHVSYRLHLLHARYFYEGSWAPWVSKTIEVRAQIWLLKHRLEAGQLLRNYLSYRLHLWHAKQFHEGSWAPWVSKTTEVRGQI